MHGTRLVGSPYLYEITSRIQKTWKRSIVSTGGYWLGSATYEGTTPELIDLFQSGLMNEIREIYGGLMTWQGFISEMTLTLGGQTYSRRWDRIANRVKTVYSTIGSNMLPNGSGESGVWTGWNSPSTLAQSTTWKTHGDYSIHVVTGGGTKGAYIDQNITIEARTNYFGQISVNVISGKWVFQLYHGSTSLAQTETEGTGEQVLELELAEENGWAGTAGLVIFSQDVGSSEIYCDACIFHTSPTRASTSWFEDTLSQSEFGVMENILSKSGMTEEAANALAVRTLYESMVPSIRASGGIGTPQTNTIDQLVLTVAGYVFTLRNKYCELELDVDTASNHIENLINDSEFIIPGSIEPNAMEYNVPNLDNYRVWDLIRNIIKDGDADGNIWNGGVYNGLQFDYYLEPFETVARIRNGKIISPDGGVFEGWLGRPGIVYFDDFPGEKLNSSMLAYNANNAVLMTEIEFDLGDYLKGLPGVRLTE